MHTFLIWQEDPLALLRRLERRVNATLPRALLPVADAEVAALVERQAYHRIAWHSSLSLRDRLADTHMLCYGAAGGGAGRAAVGRVRGGGAPGGGGARAVRERRARGGGAGGGWVRWGGARGRGRPGARAQPVGVM